MNSAPSSEKEKERALGRRDVILEGR